MATRADCYPFFRIIFLVRFYQVRVMAVGTEGRSLFAVQGTFVGMVDIFVAEAAYPVGYFFLGSMAIRTGNTLFPMDSFLEIAQRRKFRNKYPRINLNTVARFTVNLYRCGCKPCSFVVAFTAVRGFLPDAMNIAVRPVLAVNTRSREFVFKQILKGVPFGLVNKTVPVVVNILSVQKGAGRKFNRCGDSAFFRYAMTGDAI